MSKALVAVRQIENIQGLRGLAVMLVLMAHLTKIEEKYFHGSQLLSPYLSIGISGVDLFFVISGFIMVFVTRGAHQKPGSSLNFFYHRVVRIFPVYWFFSLLVLVVYLVHPEMVNSSEGNQTDILDSFLLLPQEKKPLLAVGWTLIHEMYFYVVFALLLRLPERIFSAMLVLWALLIMGFAAMGQQSASPAIQLVSSPLTLEFIAGCFIGRFYLYGKTNTPMMLLPLGFIAWLIAYAGYVGLGYGLGPDGWKRIVVFGIPATLVVCSIAIMERDGKGVLPQFLRSIGNASYSIYLSHLLVISALGRIWGEIGNSNSEINGGALLIIYVVALMAGIYCYRYLENPIQQYFHNTRFFARQPR